MSDQKKFLHGNYAKIHPRADIVPRGLNYVVTDNVTLHGEVYNRLGDDAEFCKKEVDANKK